MVKSEAVIIYIGIGFFPPGASFYQHTELFSSFERKFSFLKDVFLI